LQKKAIIIRWALNGHYNGDYNGHYTAPLTSPAYDATYDRANDCRAKPLEHPNIETKIKNLSNFG